MNAKGNWKGLQHVPSYCHSSKSFIKRYTIVNIIFIIQKILFITFFETCGPFSMSTGKDLCKKQTFCRKYYRFTIFLQYGQVVMAQVQLKRSMVAIILLSCKENHITLADRTVQITEWMLPSLPHRRNIRLQATLFCKC